MRPLIVQKPSEMEHLKQIAVALSECAIFELLRRHFAADPLWRNFLFGQNHSQLDNEASYSQVTIQQIGVALFEFGSLL